MNQNYWESQVKIKPTAEDAARGLQQFMTQTFTWMALGLALTGFVAAMTVSSEAMLSVIFGNKLVFYALIFGELGMVIAFGMVLRRGAAAPVLLALFLSYAALNGLTMSVILLVYTMESVATTFFVTAGMFGGIALYGYVTKKDLTGIGRMAGMALWGIIIAMIVNIFLGSSVLGTMISIIGVLVFTGLTAYDVQRLKAQYFATSGNEQSLASSAVGGALMLYLDFINLFLMLLRLLGNRK